MLKKHRCIIECVCVWREGGGEDGAYTHVCVAGNELVFPSICTLLWSWLTSLSRVPDQRPVFPTDGHYRSLLMAYLCCLLYTEDQQYDLPPISLVGESPSLARYKGISTDSLPSLLLVALAMQTKEHCRSKDACLY